MQLRGYADALHVRLARKQIYLHRFGRIGAILFGHHEEAPRTARERDRQAILVRRGGDVLIGRIAPVVPHRPIPGRGREIGGAEQIVKLSTPAVPGQHEVAADPFDVGLEMLRTRPGCREFENLRGRQHLVMDAGVVDAALEIPVQMTARRQGPDVRSCPIQFAVTDDGKIEVAAGPDSVEIEPAHVVGPVESDRQVGPDLIGHQAIRTRHEHLVRASTSLDIADDGAAVVDADRGDRGVAARSEGQRSDQIATTARRVGLAPDPDGKREAGVRRQVGDRHRAVDIEIRAGRSGGRIVIDVSPFRVADKRAGSDRDRRMAVAGGVREAALEFMVGDQRRRGRADGKQTTCQQRRHEPELGGGDFSRETGPGW